MISCVMNTLKSKTVVLASSSPRRQKILNEIGLNVIICPSQFEENLDPYSFNNFEEFVIETAYQKVSEVENQLKNKNTHADIIIGADTMVVLDNKLYGKPSSKEDAFKMLTQLCGKHHTVMTGVAIKSYKEIIKFCEKTDVYIANLTAEQIQAYVDTGEPLDKAGAYGIQGIGGTMVQKIEGDFYNVIGLPLHRLSEALIKICS